MPTLACAEELPEHLLGQRIPSMPTLASAEELPERLLGQGTAVSLEPALWE